MYGRNLADLPKNAGNFLNCRCGEKFRFRCTRDVRAMAAVVDALIVSTLRYFRKNVMYLFIYLFGTFINIGRTYT